MWVLKEKHDTVGWRSKHFFSTQAQECARDTSLPAHEGFLQIMFGTINGLAMNVATHVALSLVLSRRTSAIIMDFRNCASHIIEFETLNVPATYKANQAS